MKRLLAALVLIFIPASIRAATVFQSSYVAANGTAIESVTPTIGVAWVSDSGAAASTIQSNLGTIPISGNAYYHTNPGAASGSYTINFTWIFPASVASTGFLFTTAENSSGNGDGPGYFAGYHSFRNQWEISRGTGSSFTTEVHDSTIPAGGTYTCSLFVDKSVGGQVTLTLTVNGTPILTWTDTSPVGVAGACGFWGQPGSTTPANFIAISAYSIVDSSSGPATAYTMTGPTTGAAHNPYAYTVALSPTGGTSAPVTITPATSSTGVFAPTSVILSTGTQNAIFNYTPNVTGTHTISATNSGALTDPSSIPLVISTSSNFFAYTDSHLTFAPFAWMPDAPYTRSLHLGSYLKFSFTGTSLKLNLDLSYKTATFTTIYWSIDYGNSQPSTPLLSTAQLPLASGLAAGTHTCRIWTNADETNADRGNGQIGYRVSGVVLDAAASLAAYPTVGTKKILFYGDSLMEYTAPDQSDTPVDFQVWPRDVGEAMGEYGVIGFSGQGWLNSFNAGTPTFPNSWNVYYAGQTRLSSGLLSPQPDYIFVAEGQNDSGNVATTVTSTLAAIRAAAPSVPIYVIIPFSGVERAHITAGFNTWNDPNSKLIDLNTDSWFNNGPSWLSYDGTHARSHFNGILAAMIQKAIGGSSGGGINGSSILGLP